MARDGRDLERLVARIEAGLVPQGAVVTSPDFIRDKVTGQLREVDVSIRYQIGTVPILMTIECRDRSGIEDVTWIEQLATKRNHIGAAKTIAVSSTGYTGPAVTTAQRLGIEIRTMSDITDEEIACLLLVTGIKNDVCRSFLVEVAINLEGDAPRRPEELSARVKNLIQQDKVNAPVFLRVIDGTYFSAGDFLRLFKEANDFTEVPADGKRVQRRFRAELSSTPFTIETETGPVGVKGVDLTLDLVREVIHVPISNFRAYNDETCQRVIAGQATATIMGKTIVFTVIKQPENAYSVIGISHETSKIEVTVEHIDLSKVRLPI